MIRFLLFFFLSVQICQSAFAQTSPTRGERPPIDLERVNKNAYEPNKVSIKLRPDLAQKIEGRHSIEPPQKFDLPALDAVLEQYGMKKATQLFYSPALNSRFDEKMRIWGFHLWYEIDFGDARPDVVSLVKTLQRLPETEVVEPVYKKRLIAPIESQANTKSEPAAAFSMNTRWTPNDPRFNEQWHYHNTGQQNGTVDKDIDLPEAWDIEKGNSNIIVAIIDGGIQTNHPDIAANMWSGIGYNFVNNSSAIAPHNHGTHVAGTVSAVNNNGIGVSGVAGGSGGGNGVRLMSCQVFTNTSSGGFHLAPIYAANNGAAISQNSWGYTSVGVYEQNVLDAIDYFNQNGGGTALGGGITIFAAGNDNASGLWYPGCYSGAFAVAATNNNDQKAWYSNYDNWVDISAPGGETNSVSARGVLSTITNNSYAFYQGTSMACPHTSGVAALVISLANGQLTSANLKHILTNSVDDHYAQNPTFIGKLGSGRLNAHKALLLTQSFLNPAIPAPPSSFVASALSASAIGLSWALNANGHEVVLAFNTTNTFGNPSGTYLPGQTISGGGTVLYTGNLTNFQHSGLSPSTTYFYAIWSKNEGLYSAIAPNAQATTLCEVTSLPITENFNSSTFPPCWSQSTSGTGVLGNWSVSNTNKAGGSANEMKSTWQNVSSGTTRLVTRAFNTLGVSQLNLSFRHMLDAYSTGATLRIQSSLDGVNWTNEAWSVATTSSNIPATLVSTNITNNLNSSTTYIAFTVTGNLYNYDYWYIDNVNITIGSMGTPVVSTATVTGVTATSAISGGNVSSAGNSAITARGVCWNTTGNPTLLDNYTIDGTGTGSFTSTLEGLMPNTTYFIRAYATNAYGTAYGGQLNFTTSATLPILTTTPPTDVSYQSAVSGGNITYDGGAPITARGVVWSSNPQPSLGSNLGFTFDGSGSGIYTSNLDDLNLFTTYYVRAYATNIAGTAYGEEFSFTTLAMLPALSTLPPWEISHHSATTGGNITFDGGAAVSSRGVVWSDNPQPTITENLGITSDGSGSGIFFSNLSDLNPSTTYYVRAYATNSAGTAYGQEETFQTLHQDKLLNVKVYLEGPFDGQQMKSSNSERLPVEQPYNTSPWNYNGNETVSSFPENTVDWVLVELRDADLPQNATSSTIVNGWPKALLLLSNGQIVDQNGNLPQIGNSTINNNLYIVIRHRNHLAVMSNMPASYTNNTYSFDFSTAYSQVYGGFLGYKKLTENIYGMVSGEADGDGQVFTSDFNLWASDFGETNSYKFTDFDLDGNIFTSDFNIWLANFGFNSVFSGKATFKSSVPD